MASAVGGASSSNLSSLYNSANMISGLASGMDTEGMIESLVQSYSKKITSIQQQVTKTEWEQEAYRSIISKMSSFSSKYTSYSSSTNLLSNSFFTNAVNVTPKGTYANSVTASGRTTSEILLHEVSQLATSARWTTSGVKDLLGNGGQILASSALDLTEDVELGSLNGTLGLTYGDKSIFLSFDEATDTNIKSMDDLVKAIQTKLSKETITVGSTAYKASEVISVEANNGEITLKDQKGNKFYISSASGTLAKQFGLTGKELNEENKIISFRPSNSDKPGDPLNFTTTKSAAEYLSGTSMSIRLNGVNKSFKLPKIEVDGTSFKLNGKAYDTSTQQGKDDFNKAYASILNETVQKEFGSKLSVELSDGKLLFKGKNAEDEIVVNCDAGLALGIGKVATSYLSTSKTLEELGISLDPDNLTKATDKDGKELKDDTGDDNLYVFEINGVKIGNYSKNTDLATILADINNSDAGVKVSYSKLSNNFVFTAKETGSEQQIRINEGSFASKIFGATADADGNLKTNLKNYTKGQDSKFSVTINGIQKTMSRSSNSAELDGMTLNLKDTFFTAINSYTTTNFGIADSGVITNGGTMTFSFLDETGAQKEIKVNVANNSDFLDELNKSTELTNYFDLALKSGQLVLTSKVQGAGENLEILRDIPAVGKTQTLTTQQSKSFNPNSAVSFETSTNADPIVDAIKSMIADYNIMIGEIKKAYSTLPAQKSNGKPYDPLTDEDMEDMSQSAIEKYEEKAKQGLLFGDSTLSSLYEKLRFIFSPSGKDGALLQKMGISTSYSSSDGALTVTVDETKLKAMLESDPDAVADVFSRSSSGNDGIMQKLKTQMDAYAATTGAVKGILVRKAGTPLSSLSLLNNTLQTKIDGLNKDIESWQDKLASKVDYYTKQFTRLETLINEMNSQSGALAGLMGG